MPFNRRNFIRLSGLSLLPAVMPAVNIFAGVKEDPAHFNADELPVKFFGDGEMFNPSQYLDILKEINTKAPIEPDRYGSGGAVLALEKKFTEITGKERAIFMPSGTMANQLAIAVLSGQNTKVFVQDTSHVYRDEADAAQSIFQKRLMPLAKDKTCFTAAELKQAVETLGEQEVFQSGVGAVSIENPVRRTDGGLVSIEEIKKISEYCRGNNIKLHLDGARIYMASAWSGVSVKEYASYFDTIYISLYKYLGASGGAVLCGDKSVIDKMPHLVKVHGGSMYGNWTNAAMALHRLEGVESRLKEAIKRSDELFSALNKMPGLKISPVENGTNIYKLDIDNSIDRKKFLTSLRSSNIRIPVPEKGTAFISVNETLLYKDVSYIIDAFKKALS